MANHQPDTAIQLLFRRRRQLASATWLEIRSRYAGSLVGSGWAILSPLILVAIYSCVYLFIFKVRVPEMSPYQYVLYVVSGLMPYLMTAEAVSNATPTIAGNTQVLSNTVFPVALMPVRSVFSSQGSMVVAVPIFIVASIALGTASTWLSLLPVIWLLHLGLVIGVAWLAALLNTILRDVQSIIGVLFIVLLIASPFAYTPDMVPAALKPLIYLNPMAYFIMAYQSVVVLGQPPSPLISAAIVVMGIGGFLLGGRLFDRLKSGVIDHV
ncbi:MAG: ABC transporter permease [Actinomycetales bacterium]|nr:ABC transporter permease [Actinomycetales bacterium]